jgi:hypothetical protein
MGYSYYIILDSEEDRNKLFNFLEKEFPEEFMIDISYQNREDHKYIIGVNCVLSTDVLDKLLILSYILWRYKNKPKEITLIYDGIEEFIQQMSDNGLNLNAIKIIKRYRLNINSKKIIQDLEERYNLENSLGF